jgi:hypothetical protein
MSTSSAGGNGTADHPPGDATGPPGRPRPVLGVLIVVVAVVIGVLLLPSATRLPLAANASPATTTTVAVAGSAHGHGHGSGHSSTTTTSTTVPPSAIHVLVANATTTNGVAGAVTTFLASKGFATLTATNALVKVTSSEIYTVGGATADTDAVTTVLGLAPTSIEPAAAAGAPVSSTAGANVVVIVGPDLAARFNPKTSSAPAG